MILPPCNDVNIRESVPHEDGYRGILQSSILGENPASIHLLFHGHSHLSQGEGIYVKVCIYRCCDVVSYLCRCVYI